MHLDSPDSWRIVWVVAAGVFAVAEMARRLRLWFLPFTVGAGVAAVTAWAGLSVALEWAVFDLKRGHLELWARTMEEQGLARATIGRRLSTVAGFYLWAPK